MFHLASPLPGSSECWPHREDTLVPSYGLAANMFFFLALFTHQELKRSGLNSNFVQKKKKSLLVGVRCPQKMYVEFWRHLFIDVSSCLRPFCVNWSHYGVVTHFGHCVQLVSKPSVHPASTFWFMSSFMEITRHFSELCVKSKLFFPIYALPKV